MKPKTLLQAILIVLLFSACHSDPEKNTANADIPEALSESKGDVIPFSRSSRDGNMVDQMYDGLKGKTPELKTLAESIDAFREGKNDSLNAYQIYKSNVNRYYSSANEHLTDIKDSVLRNRLRILLTNREKSFKQSISDVENMKQTIAANDTIIRDYYEALKIEATLPLIASYQHNKPTTKPVKAVINESKKLKKQTIEEEKKYSGKLAY